MTAPLHLGPFVLDSLLGEGGMGTVYKATDVSLSRTVALKILNPDLTANVTARRRMLAEDPVGQSWYYMLEQTLLWNHLLGATLDNQGGGQRLHPDGVAARTISAAGGGQCPRPGRLDMDVASFIMLSRSNGSCQQKYQQSSKISQ